MVRRGRRKGKVVAVQDEEAQEVGRSGLDEVRRRLFRLIHRRPESGRTDVAAAMSRGVR